MAISKTVELELHNQLDDSFIDFSFEITPDAYNKLQNAMASSKDKIAPLHNFAVSCVDKNQRADFVAYLQANDGVAAQIAGTLIDEYLPKVEITVKKPKTGNDALLPMA